MSIKWQRQEVDEIEIRCPYCHHKAAPPVYPYCKHTVFVYVDPSSDNPGFDFVTPEFAAAYLSILNTSGVASEEDMDVSQEAERQFMQGELPPFHEQEIRLYDNLISDRLFLSNATVFEVREKEGDYPTRVVIAFQMTSGNRLEGEQDAQADAKEPHR